MMFADFTIKTGGQFSKIRINPAYVASVLEVGPEETRVALASGTEHTLSEPMDVVTRRLEEAHGPVAI